MCVFGNCHFYQIQRFDKYFFSVPSKMGYICNVTFSEDGVRITKTPTCGVKPKYRFVRFKSGTKPRIKKLFSHFFKLTGFLWNEDKIKNMQHQNKQFEIDFNNRTSEQIKFTADFIIKVVAPIVTKHNGKIFGGFNLNY